MKGTKSRKINWLVVSFAVLLVLTLLIYLVSSSSGSVRIKQVSVLGDDGLTYSMDVYIPRTATDETPAPVVIYFTGGQPSAEKAADYGVEFARRGYVVVLPDGRGKGDSEIAEGSAKNEQIFEYFLHAIKGFSFVDTDQMSIIGHSVGSNTVTNVVAAHPGEFKNLIVQLAMGFTKTTRQDISGTNVLVTVSLQDHYWRGYTDEEADAYMVKCMKKFAPELESWQTGVLYGDHADGTAFLAEWTETPVLHTSANFDTWLISESISWIEKSCPAPNPIDAGSLICQWRDIFGLCAIAAMFWFIIMVALTFLKTPYFQTLVTELPECIGQTGTKWWISAVLAVIVSMVVFTLTAYIPAPEISHLFNLNSFENLVWYFAIMPVVDLLLFYVTFHRGRKKAGVASAKNYSIVWPDSSKKENAVKIGKSLLLATIVCFVIYSYLNIIKRALGINFQWWFISFSRANFETVINAGGTVLLFMWVFITAQLPANVIRRRASTGNEAKDMAIAVISNMVIAALPWVIIGVVQAYMLNFHSTIWEATAIQKFYGLPIAIAGASAIHTVMHRKTGTIWVGAFICAIFIGIFVAATNPFEAMFLV